MSKRTKRQQRRRAAQAKKMPAWMQDVAFTMRAPTKEGVKAEAKYRARQLGKLGAASGVRHIDPTGYVPAEAKGAAPTVSAPRVVALEKQADRLLAQKPPKPKRVQRPFHRPWRDPMAQAFKRAMADPDA